MNAVVSLNHFCELHGPSVVLSSQAFHCTEHVSLSKDTEDLIASGSCEACQAFSSRHRGFVSCDAENSIRYVTKQAVSNSKVAQLIKSACIQSLSCEVTPGKEGPVFFGSGVQTYTLSHTFSLKDAQARGFQRWFSLTIVTRDKFFLLNSWQFFVDKMQKFIQELQKKALQVYEQEKSIASSKSSSSCIGCGPFRRQPPANKSRSLFTLTGDDLIFARLHLWFTWLLKAGVDHWSEKIIEGLPNLESHQQQEVENGFTLISDASPKSYANVFTTNCVCEVLNSYSLRRLYNDLGSQQFLILAYNLMIGRQIVIIGRNHSLVSAVVSCFKMLVPQPCHKAVLHSHTYLDMNCCNILGLVSDDIPVPFNIVRLNVNNESNTACRFEVIWNGLVPDKYPTVLLKIKKAIENERMKDSVIHYQCIALQEEWLNIARILSKAQGSKSELDALAKSLGVQPQDILLLRFWSVGVHGIT